MKGGTMKSLAYFRGIYSEAQSLRAANSARWNEIGKFIGITSGFSVNPAAATTDSKVSTESMDLDQGVFDPTAVLACRQVSQYLLSLMFGQRQSFQLVPKKEEYAELLRKASDQANDKLSDERGFFYQNMLSLLRNSTVPFGNGGMTVEVIDDYLRFTDAPLEDTMIYSGGNGVDFLIHSKLYTPWEFVETFESYGEIPEQIKSRYESGAWQRDIQVVHIIYPNSTRQKGVKGTNGVEYKGVYFLENTETDWRVDEDYNIKQFVYFQDVKMKGELYARSDATSVINSIKTLNDTIGIAMLNAEQLGNPPKVLNTDALAGEQVNVSPGATLLASGEMGLAGSPVLQTMQVGNSGSIVQFLAPYLKDSITQFFGVDKMLDFNNKSNMTLGETLQRAVIRNQTLLPVYLLYRNQIVLPLAKIVAKLCIMEGLIDWEELKPDAQFFNDVLNDRAYEVQPLNPMEDVFTNNTMQKLLEIVNQIAALQGIWPQANLSIKYYELLVNAVQGSYLENYIVSKEEFEQRKQAYSNLMANQMVSGNQPIDPISATKNAQNPLMGGYGSNTPSGRQVSDTQQSLT